MKSLFRMWDYMARYKWEALLAAVLLMGVVASDLGVPRLTQRVIDQGIAKGDLNVVITTSMLMLGVSVLSALFMIGNTILAVRVGQSFGADLRSAMVHKVQTFSFGNLDDVQTGQLLVRTTSDVSQVQNMVMMSLRIFTRAPLWLLGSVVMLALNSPELVPLMLVLMVIVLTVIIVFLWNGRDLFTVVQQKLDKLNQVLQENLAGARVVKAFVRVEHENARFDDVNRDLMHSNIKVMQMLAFLMPIMTLVINFGVVGVVWLGGTRFVAGGFTIGEIVASFNYLTFSLFPMLMLAGMLGPIAAADASASRVFEVLDAEAEVQNTPRIEMPDKLLGRVTFEDVCFSYDGIDSSEPVLNGINLVAEPGQTIAILGSTGSGKSTLIHLIPRFYDVGAGRVTMDGVDVRDLPLEDLRSQVGIAMQEAVLFSGTIRDNIRYGKPEATDTEVVDAARAAQAHDFVMEFPQGYDTQLGQRGVNLSGGQKQRLSIARALLVKPKVLILDDSTSSVDVETESKIEIALQTLLKDSTAFVIAQRISTVLNADKIVVLDRGKIVAEGTHTELIERSEIYREIYDSQLGERAMQTNLANQATKEE